MRPSHTRLVCHMIWDRRAGYARRLPREILCRPKRRRILPAGRAPCYNGRGSTDIKSESEDTPMKSIALDTAWKFYRETAEEAPFMMTSRKN